MALAYLMKGITESELGVKLRISAFVVNHQARDGSTEEAIQVSDWLQRLGMMLFNKCVPWSDFDRHSNTSSHDQLEDIKSTRPHKLRVRSKNTALSVSGSGCSAVQDPAPVSGPSSRRSDRNRINATCWVTVALCIGFASYGTKCTNTLL